MQRHVVAAVSAAAFAAVLSAPGAHAANVEITNVGFIGASTNIFGFFNGTGVETGIILLTAEAHPTPYSLSLFPGAKGEAFGAGQAFSAAIPEPGTWAMMLLGFAGLGFAGWRRTRPKLLIVE